MNGVHLSCKRNPPSSRLTNSLGAVEASRIPLFWIVSLPLWRYYTKPVCSPVSLLATKPSTTIWGCRSQAFGGIKKTPHLVMCPSATPHTIRHPNFQATCRNRGSVMGKINVPATLSPCVRIFLEGLCSEINEADLHESRLFAFRQTLKQPQRPTALPDQAGIAIAAG